MKKNSFIQIFVLTIIVIGFTNCASILGGNLQGSAALNQSNFSYVKKDIKGSSTATYIFGIGGMNRQAIAAEAKENLLKENPLKDNQALANITVNFKASSILGIIYQTTKCTITADIVEFKK